MLLLNHEHNDQQAKEVTCMHDRVIEIVPYNYIFEGEQNYGVMFDLGTSNE